MIIVMCIKDYGKYWRVGEGFGADIAKVIDNKIVGVDVDGRKFTFPVTNFKLIKDKHDTH